VPIADANGHYNLYVSDIEEFCKTRATSFGYGTLYNERPNIGDCVDTAPALLIEKRLNKMA